MTFLSQVSPDSFNNSVTTLSNSCQLSPPFSTASRLAAFISFTLSLTFLPSSLSSINHLTLFSTSSAVTHPPRRRSIAISAANPISVAILNAFKCCSAYIGQPKGSPSFSPPASRRIHRNRYPLRSIPAAASAACFAVIIPMLPKQRNTIDASGCSSSQWRHSCRARHRRGWYRGKARDVNLALELIKFDGDFVVEGGKMENQGEHGGVEGDVDVGGDAKLVGCVDDGGGEKVDDEG
ncbi:hypothetical protein M5K25_025481 [Dendrobium thyrsiflorum]|uniref:Uncharacterized protein n=1 Tax=Dendrobium thyrsiflorum TaxID=117978 RepID=A0ABD0U461_DENTH